MRRGLIALAILLLTAAAVAFIGHQSAFAVQRLIICLLVFVFVAAAAWAAPGRLRNGLIVAASLVFGLTILEGATLVFGLRPKVAAADAGIAHARPIVGWGPTQPGVFDIVKKNADGGVVYATKVTIDDHLNRKTSPSAGRGAVAFFGDSFVFGDGVEDKGALPQAFADLNRGKIPALNLAFSGWSPAQNLAALQADLYRPLLDKPGHFVLFTSPFHIERTACLGAFAVSTAPRFILEGNTLERAGECAGWASRLFAPVFKFAQGFAVFQRAAALAAAPTKRDVETYIRIVEAFAATAKQKYGVRTTVLFWPTGDGALKGTGYTESDILAAFKKADLDVLIDKLPNSEDDGTYRIVGDGHPTARANETVARMLQNHLRDVDPQALAINEEAR